MFLPSLTDWLIFLDGLKTQDESQLLAGMQGMAMRIPEAPQSITSRTTSKGTN